VKKNIKTKQQLILEMEELRKRLKATERPLKDMTAREQPQEALKISETRYRRLFETAQDGILILDAETGQISDVNPFLVEMLGYSYEIF
jgi:two-component system CheB/CheR fusion protein